MGVPPGLAKYKWASNYCQSLAPLGLTSVRQGADVACMFGGGLASEWSEGKKE